MAFNNECLLLLAGSLFSAQELISPMSCDNHRRGHLDLCLWAVSLHQMHEFCQSCLFVCLFAGHQIDYKWSGITIKSVLLIYFVSMFPANSPVTDCKTVMTYCNTNQDFHIYFLKGFSTGLMQEYLKIKISQPVLYLCLWTRFSRKFITFSCILMSMKAGVPALLADLGVRWYFLLLNGPQTQSEGGWLIVKV